MCKKKINTIKTISAYHQLRGLPKPEHPLISVINLETVQFLEEKGESTTWLFEFYSIALKRNFGKKVSYGQQQYDFDEGVLFFIAPRQIFSIQVDASQHAKMSGWMLLVHPDFFWNTALATTITQYAYFGYEVNEALFLSEKEEKTIIQVLQNIKRDYQANIDAFSQNIILAQLDLLFSYADRYYHRQFLTRKVANHQLLERLENLLKQYFEGEIMDGLLTVQFVAKSLNVSPNYLSSLLKVLTGQTTQQHIHNKLIEKAKERLSCTNLSVSQIAYTLGFEHTQSFSKLFKTKTGWSPVAFRKSFN